MEYIIKAIWCKLVHGEKAMVKGERHIGCVTVFQWYQCSICGRETCRSSLMQNMQPGKDA